VRLVSFIIRKLGSCPSPHYLGLTAFHLVTCEFFAAVTRTWRWPLTFVSIPAICSWCYVWASGSLVLFHWILSVIWNCECSEPPAEVYSCEMLYKVNLAHLRGNIKCLKMFLYWWLTTVIHFLALTCSSLFGLRTEIHMPQLQCFMILKKFLHNHHDVILHCKSNKSFIPFPGLIYHIISGSRGKWW